MIPAIEGGTESQVETSASDHEEVEWQFDAPDLGLVQDWLILAVQPDEAVAGDAELGAQERGETQDEGQEPAATPLDLDWPTVQPGPVVAIEDAYLDSADWRLYRAGYSLRVRRTAGRAEATLKSLARVEQGPQRRREITEFLPQGDLAAEAIPDMLTALPGPVGERVRLAAGTHPVRVLFTLHTLRRGFALSIGGEGVGEVVLDETRVDGGGEDSATGIARVEVEAAGSGPADRGDLLSPFVERLQDDCGLTPAGQSKFEAGLAACGLRPAGWPDSSGAGEVAGAAGTATGGVAAASILSMGQLAYRALGRAFAALLNAEPGTRLGEDPEALHDMRVATRRMRSLMRLFARVLPEDAQLLAGELRWLAGLLGEVRDRDVLIAGLAGGIHGGEPMEPGALADVLAIWDRRRVAARSRLVLALDSVRYDALIGALAEWVHKGPPEEIAAAGEPARLAAPAYVRRLYRRVRHDGDRLRPGSPAADFHALRIQVKRLRYVLDSVAELYGKPGAALIAAATRCQDLLGRHQDADVARQQLLDTVTDYGRDLPGTTVFAMGEAAARYQVRAKQLRADFPKTYRGLRGKTWRRLQQRLKRTAARAADR